MPLAVFPSRRRLIDVAFAMSGLSKLAALRGDDRFGRIVEAFASSAADLRRGRHGRGRLWGLDVAGYPVRAAAGVLALFCIPDSLKDPGRDLDRLL
jgi:hypothetical protein